MSTRRGKQSTTVKMKHTNPTPASQNLTKQDRTPCPNPSPSPSFNMQQGTTAETLASHNLNKDHSIPSPNPASSVQESQPPNPGHCSPPKKATKEPTTNNTVIGYVHNLSPFKAQQKKYVGLFNIHTSSGGNIDARSIVLLKDKAKHSFRKRNIQNTCENCALCQNLRRQKAGNK